MFHEDRESAALPDARIVDIGAARFHLRARQLLEVEGANEPPSACARARRAALYETKCRLPSSSFLTPLS